MKICCPKCSYTAERGSFSITTTYFRCPVCQEKFPPVPLTQAEEAEDWQNAEDNVWG
jgi:hypothetical protein